MVKEMVLFKSCPKCRTGDMAQMQDSFGWYLKCLQCGFLKDLDVPPRDDSALGENFLTQSLPV